MPLAGYDVRAVPAGLTPECPLAEPTKWLRQLHESVAQLAPLPLARGASGTTGTTGVTGIVIEASVAANTAPPLAPVIERGTPAN